MTLSAPSSTSGVLAVPSVISSTGFYLAAGTVTVDLVARKVLIVRDLSNNTFQLPRGRKDWGEPLAQTAVRETFEETGVRPRLLPVPLSTRATAPQRALTDHSHPYHVATRSASFDVATGDLLIPGSARLAEEPFALMQHYQPNGALALVMWYVGVANSLIPKQTGTQMADEEYESHWVGYDEAVQVMVDEKYAEVVKSAVRLVEQVVDEEGAQIVMAGDSLTQEVNGGLLKGGISTAEAATCATTEQTVDVCG